MAGGSGLGDIGHGIALLRFHGFGAKRMARLRAGFSGMQEAFEASRGRLLRAGIEPHVADAFICARPGLDPDRELEILRADGLDAIPIDDPRYPPLLKEIHDPPDMLFARGALPKPGRAHLAVIGARKHGGYGAQVARELVEPAARAGAVIVSGLALGIDAIAHQAALAAGGTTVAVLGAGADRASVYPARNRALAERIVERGGCLLSEFPARTQVRKQNFPFRNRVIAGLCEATLVIEATIKSGSLITARSALSENRDVLAVPGPITSALSEGPNNLLRMGATPVTRPEDLLEALALEARKAPPAYRPGSPEEAAVYEALSREPRHVDELVVATGLGAPKVAATLALMEMKGSARHLGGLSYVRG